VTSIEAPSAATVIPDKARIGGSFRIAQTHTRERLEQLIQDVATATAAAHDLTCDVKVSPRYDATVNHAAEAERFRTALRDELGENGLSQTTPIPIMASEDFSYYLQHIPGAFALIGADDGLHEHQRPCHSPEYDFNDTLIAQVTRLYSRLVGAPLPSGSS